MFYSQERFTTAKSVKTDKYFLANAIGIKTSDHPSSIPTTIIEFLTKLHASNKNFKLPTN